MINKDEDFSQEEFEEGDYEFVINANGELKSIMIPEDLMDDPPKSVARILKIFGIKDIHTLTSGTLH
jgi:hypothetical protein